MGICRNSNRYKIQQIFAFAVIFFTVACIFQIISVPSTSNSESTSPKNYLPEFIQNDPTEDDQVFRFHSVPKVELEKTHPVVLRGVQHLPGNLEEFHENANDLFQYYIEPTRLVNGNGLLALREFQGNSWSGTIMKGALIFFVQTSAHQYRRRALQRSTWGCIRDVDGWKTEIVFVLGVPHDGRIQSKIEEENRKHGDILQYRGPDSENYSSSKILSGLQWAATRLPGDFYYASASDTVLLNIGMIRDRINAESMRESLSTSVHVSVASDGSTVTSPLPQIVYCFEKIFDPSQLVVNVSQSWWGYRTVQTVETTWPPHCSDGLYLFPVSLAMEFVEVWRNTDSTLPDSLHDVLVTGILRRKLKRGDDNIVDASDKVPVVRFDIPGEASRLDDLDLYNSIKTELRSMWAFWYKGISGRYHIITNIDDWT